MRQWIKLTRRHLISELKVTKAEGHMHASYKGKKKMKETNKNDKSDDGEGLDAVQPKAVKKKFDDRKDKDIDNDGDTDSSDEYLHKKRKAISKSMKETWAEAVRKVKENENGNGNGEDPSDEDDEDKKKSNGKKAKVEINPEIEEKKK
jgi:hypothetical protein